MPGIDDIGRLREVLAEVHNNVGTKPRQIWYVDATNGHANYDGLSRLSAFATIGAALAAASAGDLIHIAQGNYDEAVAIPGALTGLQVICEPGVFISNTTPGTVVTVNPARMYWEGGIISQAGQVGFLILGSDFVCRNTKVNASTLAYDIGASRSRFTNCVAEDFSSRGFETVGDSGIFVNCTARGQAATRGFYLSAGTADSNIFLFCHTLGCTAAGYETVAGADENLFAFCSQSSLCAGPTDGGANNTWASHSQDSQITAGNTLQEDLAALHGAQGRILCAMDFWSIPQEEVAVTNVAGDKALPDVTVADLPAGATIVRAIAMFKFRMVENTYAGVNKLNGAQEIQVRDDSPSAWVDGINFVDDLFTLADSAREGGDVMIGAIDVSGTVDENDTYNFQWDEAIADQDGINFNDIQVGIRIWYSI